MCIHSRRRARSAPAGFTLVEMLVAVVISGFMVTVLFQLLIGQGRFVQLQSSQEEVQQNARAAVEIVASELRTVPPGAIIQANDNALEFRLPRAWGTLCSPLTSASTTMQIVVPTGLFPAAEFASNGVWGVAVPGATERDWVGISSVTAVKIDPALPFPCGAMFPQLTVGVWPAGVDVWQLAFTATSVSVPAARSVFIFQRVRYDTGNPAGVAGTWVQRNLGLALQQPMAGPLLGGAAGLQFRYFTSSNTPITAPGMNNAGSAATFRSLSRVGVVVSAESQYALNGRRRTDTDSVTVYLRNLSSGSN
jgi:prepilin-type N-terminal cleavage/methylation domain-containing protein